MPASPSGSGRSEPTGALQILVSYLNLYLRRERRSRSGEPYDGALVAVAHSLYVRLANPASSGSGGLQAERCEWVEVGCADGSGVRWLVRVGSGVESAQTRLLTRLLTRHDGESGGDRWASGSGSGGGGGGGGVGGRIGGVGVGVGVGVRWC